MKATTPNELIFIGGQGLPILTEGLILARIREIDPVLEKAQINRQTKTMKAIHNAYAFLRIQLRHLGGPMPITPDNLITELIGFEQKLRN